MNVPIEIFCIFLSSVLALQGWTLITVIKLNTKVAVLTQRMEDAGI